MRQAVVEAVFPVSVERLWRALTDPRALARWLAPNDFAPRLGQQFHLWVVAADGAPRELSCRVVALEPPRLLAFTWAEPDAAPTLVTLTLEAKGQGAHLRLVHSDFQEALPVESEGSATGGAERLLRGRPLAAQRTRRGDRPMSQIFHYQVDEEALIDGITAFVREQNAARRNALPIARELQEGPNFLIPFDVLETMVLDGVDQRQDVADYVHFVVQRSR